VIASLGVPLTPSRGFAHHIGHGAACGLFSRCSPQAILRRVRAIVISSLNCGEWRTRPHIGQKVLKGYSPTFTDSNPSPAITMKADCARRIATLFHGLPRIIFAAAPSIRPRGSMLLNSSSTVTAGGGFAASQVRSLRFSLSSTDTSTQPEALLFSGTSLIKNSEKPESLASQRERLHLPSIADNLTARKVVVFGYGR